MRKLPVLCLGLFLSFSSYAQDRDEQSIRHSLDLFFEAITEQDSIKFKQAMDLRGQLYYSSVSDEPAKYGMSTFEKAMNRFDTSKSFLETAFGYDIRIRKSMATAWVPYEFIIDGKFSHCGVDVFTLMKQGENWKIVSVAFTRETKNCGELTGKD